MRSRTFQFLRRPSYPRRLMEPFPAGAYAAAELGASHSQAPRLTPRAPPMPVQDEYDSDDGEGYAPRAMGECMLGAYIFDRTSHGRSVPPLTDEQRAKATAARQEILTKRHHSRAKLGQQPVEVHRKIQWKSLVRRSQQAASQGNVSLLATRTVTSGAAVVAKDYKGRDVICTHRLNLTICCRLENRVWWRLGIIRVTQTTGWESSPNELALPTANALITPSTTNNRPKFPLVIAHGAKLGKFGRRMEGRTGSFSASNSVSPINPHGMCCATLIDRPNRAIWNVAVRMSYPIKQNRTTTKNQRGGICTVRVAGFRIPTVGEINHTRWVGFAIAPSAIL